MNNLVFEDENNSIEISEDESEILICKQLLKPEIADFSLFVFENFEEKFIKNSLRKDLFKIAKIFFKKYNIVPSYSVIQSILKNDKFNSKKDELIEEYKNIVNFKEDNFNDKFIKDIIIKFTKIRQIYFTILEQFEDIEKNGDIGNCLERFEKIVQIDISDDLGIEYFENLNNHCNDLISIESRMKFGYNELDKYTYGGLPTNDACLFIIMAQPGLGKSQLMMNIAHNWVMQNKKVLMISLEMSENMYSRRMDGLFADLNVNKLKENVGLLKLKVQTVKSNLPDALLRIKEFPTGTCTPAKLKQFLKKLKTSKDFEPDLICVDYLNIMKPNNSNGNISLYEKCAKISEELRAISCELKIPIISAVQANRGPNGYSGADIDMSNVSESSGITATADALVALYQLEGERECNRINLKILKNRLGGYIGQTIKFEVNYETLKISDCNEIDENEGNELLGDVKLANNDMFEPEIQKNIKNKNSIGDI